MRRPNVVDRHMGPVADDGNGLKINYARDQAEQVDSPPFFTEWNMDLIKKSEKLV